LDQRPLLLDGLLGLLGTLTTVGFLPALDALSSAGFLLNAGTLQLLVCFRILARFGHLVFYQVMARIVLRVFSSRSGTR
jgi:hypothetical protein